MQTRPQLFTGLAEHRGQILCSGAKLAKQSRPPSLTSKRGQNAIAPRFRVPSTELWPPCGLSVFLLRDTTQSLFQWFLKYRSGFRANDQFSDASVLGYTQGRFC